MTTKLPIDPNNLPVNTGNLYPPVLLTGLANDVEYTVTIVAHLADGTTITESRTVKPHADPAPASPIASTMNGMGLTGTGTPGYTVKLYDSHGGLAAEVPVDIAGHWSIPTSMFPHGTTDGFSGSLTITDSNGNESTPTEIASIDSIPPTDPVTTAINGSGMSGTAEPGATVYLLGADGKEITSVKVDSTGHWFIPASSFPNGVISPFVGSIKVVDPAGNESAIVNLNISVDITAPTPPIPTIQNATGLSGVTEPNSTINLLDRNGNIVVTVTADGSGHWAIPASSFHDEPLNGFSGSIVSVDAAGNISKPTAIYSIDGIAPTAPVITIANASGLSGTAEANTTIKLYNSSNTFISKITVDVLGNWAFMPGIFIDGIDGFSGSVTSTDLANNVSTSTSVPTIDGLAPNPPVITVANASGLFGTAEPLAVIRRYNSFGIMAPGAIADNSGNWSILPTSFDRNSTNGFTGYITQTDTAGNTSAQTAIPAIDGIPPIAPTLLVANYYGINGTAEAGSRISLKNSTGTEVAFTFTDMNGNWSIPSNSFPGKATDGFTGSITATDLAGNESLATTLPAINGLLPVAALTDYTDDVGTIQSTTSTAVTTDDTTPGINIGVGVIDTPILYIGGVLTASTYGSITGTLTPNDALTDGTYDFTYTLTDADGNVSLPSPVLTITIDTTAPTTPSAPTTYDDNVGSVQSATGAALTTDDTTPGINIGASLTETPKLYINDALVTSTYNSSTGTLTPNTALTEGNWNFSYTLTDAAGNESSNSPPLTITIDLTAPATPTAPTSYVDDYGSITNLTSTDLVTDDTTPGINIGSGLIDTPKLYVGGILTTSTYDSVAGTLTPNSALPEGVNVLTYTLTDAAGNESSQSPSITITIDITPPTTTAITSYVDNVGSIQSTTSVAVSTDDTTPGINIGTGLTTIPKLYIGGILTAATYNSINGTLTPNVALAQGTYSFTYTLTDVVGNQSLPSAAFSITIDTTAPTTPITAITSYVDNVGSIQSTTNTAIVTDDTTPGINVGTGLTDTVTLYVNDSAVVSTYDSVAGTLTPFYPLAEGTYAFSYSLTDVVGNESGKSPSISITIDTTPPTTPLNKPTSYVDNVGTIQNATSNAAVTDDSTPGINIGAGLSNPKLYVNGVYTAATYVSGTGIITPNSALTDGLKSITYTLSDTAGNESGQSPAITLTIDTVAPTVSTPTTFLDNVGDIQSVANTSSATDDNRPGINIGTGLTDTVKLYIDTVLTPSSYDSVAGTLTPTLAVPDGYHEFAYTLTDIAGNESALSGVKPLTIDTIAPTITSVTPSWGAVLQYSEMLSNGTVTIVSSGAENDSVTSIVINGIIYTGAVTNNSSVITIPYADFANLTNGGTYYINATLTDIAGNSTSNNTVSFTVDSTPSGFISILARDVSTDNEMGWGIALDSSKNKYVMGYGSDRSNLDDPGESHLQIIKYNSAGTMQWHKDTGEININSVTYLTLRGFAIDGSGNMYVVGQRYYSLGSNTSYFTMLIIKVDSNGVFQWSNQLGYTTSGVNNPNDNKFYSIVLDSSANAYVVGISDVNESITSYDIIIAKYSSSGSLLWKKTLDYGPNPPNAEYGFSITINAANSYLYAVGRASSDYGYYSATLICYNTSGTLQWQRSIANAWFKAVAVDSSDNIYAGGFEDSSKTTILCKYNSVGILQKQSYVNGLPGSTANREVLMKLVTYGTTLFFAIGNLIGSIETTTWTLNWVNKVTANSSLIYLANDIKFDTDGNINLSGTFTDGGSIDIGQNNPTSNTNLIGLLVLRVDGSQLGTYTVNQSPFTSVTIANVSGVSLATSALLPSDGALSEITYTIPSTSVSMTTTDVTSSSSTDTTYISGSQTPNTIPDSPTSVTATALDQRAFVTFTPPINNGGSGITNFTATSNPGNISVTSTSSPIQLTGLTNGTSYTFTVVATNSTGNSIPSSASNSVTPVTDTIGSGNNSIGYWLGTAGDGVSKMYVAPKSTERAVAWGSYGSVRGTTSTTNGISNTNTLYARGSAITTGHPAAYYAKVLSTGGYNTWYLPAKDEIATCWTNRLATPFSTANSFLNAAYWSSTEDTNNNAWYQVSTDTKSTPNYIRAVRRSTI